MTRAENVAEDVGRDRIGPVPPDVATRGDDRVQRLDVRLVERPRVWPRRPGRRRRGVPYHRNRPRPRVLTAGHQRATPISTTAVTVSIRAPNASPVMPPSRRTT